MIILGTLIFYGIKLVSADQVNFNLGGDSNTCINSGQEDSCNFNYIPIIEAPSGPPQTSSVTYTNISNITVPKNKTVEKNITETTIKEIEDSGKKINIWIFILIGIVSLLILIVSVLFDVSKRKISRDGILFIVTCLIFSLIALILSIYYKSLYSLILLVIIVLIFMSMIGISIVTKDNKKGADIFGAMAICLISLVFSGLMLIIKNYLIASITISISLIILLISITILIDNNLKKKKTEE